MCSSERGLYGKYIVIKIDGEDNEPLTDVFVLRPEKDPVALVAIRAYANTTDNAELARGLFEWANDIQFRSGDG